MDKSPRTVEEKEIGHKCADALAVKLVDQLRGMGYRVLRETEVMGTTGNMLNIHGQFISINEGNQAERVVIGLGMGLGMGRTDVKTNVQIYEQMPKSTQLVESFTTDAKSGMKPGMAATGGSGAVPRHAGTRAAASRAGAARRAGD